MKISMLAMGLAALLEAVGNCLLRLITQTFGFSKVMLMQLLKMYYHRFTTASMHEP